MAAQGHKKPKIKLNNCLMVWDIDLCPLVGFAGNDNLSWEEEQGALLSCSKGGEAGQGMHGGALLEETPLASCKLQTAAEPLW